VRRSAARAASTNALPSTSARLFLFSRFARFSVGARTFAQSSPRRRTLLGV
jgi:hypothetical protein